MHQHHATLRFATLAASAGLAMLLASPALAQDKTFDLKLSHWVPRDASAAEGDGGVGRFGREGVGRHASSSRSIPAQQLGKAFDHYDMARDGIADFAYINPGYQPGRFPIIAAGELPFLVGDAKGGIRAIDAWYRKYARDRDEGREVLLLVHPRSADLAFAATRRSWCRATSRA